jgi:hypothetical protein
MLHRVPALEIVKGFPGDWIKLTKLAAAKDDCGAYAFVYFPNDTLKAEIRVGEISGEEANAWWYNPRDGETYNAEGGKTQLPFNKFPCGLHQTYVFDPPGDDGYGKDWMLILDDSEKGYLKP